MSMDRKEKKDQDINIRIESSIKNFFKKKCEKENKTMSEKISEFILNEIKEMK